MRHAHDGLGYALEKYVKRFNIASCAFKSANAGSGVTADNPELVRQRCRFNSNLVETSYGTRRGERCKRLSTYCCVAAHRVGGRQVLLMVLSVIDTAWRNDFGQVELAAGIVSLFNRTYSTLGYSAT